MPSTTGLVLAAFIFNVINCDTDGLYCYECDNVAHGRDCNHIAKCAPHEVCSNKRFVTHSGIKYYQSGCIAMNFCPPSSRRKRSDFNDCTECCTYDYCNKDLCDSPKVTENENRCLKCDDVDHPSMCRDVTRCGPDQVCFAEENFNLGINAPRFVLGCRDKMLCYHHRGSLVGRNVETRSTACQECCNTENCNRELCETAPLMYTSQPSTNVAVSYVDECRSSPCHHGGTCINGHFSYTCQCNKYYKGSNCQTACHSVKADIMMLLDSSASVGSTYFRKQLQFVQSVVNSFDIGQSSVNMGVVTFSSAPHPQFKLNDYQTKHSLIDAINRIHHQSGGTNTDSAIDYLLKHSFTARNGDRSDAPNIAVIITDGQSSSRQSTIREANLLHNRGITTVAIGIGGGINLKELIGIASNQSLVFTVANFDALHTIQGLVDHSICQASAGGVPTIWPGMIG